MDGEESAGVVPHDWMIQARRVLWAAYGQEERWTADGGYATPGEWLAGLIESVRQELRDIEELPEAVRFAFAEDVMPIGPAAEALDGEWAGEILSAFAERLAGLERAEPTRIATLFRELRADFKSAHGVRGRDVMFPIRAALTGRVQGPCLEVVVCLLGKQRCLARVSRQLAQFSEVRDDATGV